MNLAMEFRKHWKIPHVLSSDIESWVFKRYFPKVEARPQFSTCHGLAEKASESASHPMGAHRSLGGFHRVSTQVTSLLGRKPDRKLEVGHGFSWKTSIQKREVDLRLVLGGTGWLQNRDFCFTPNQLVPLLEAQHISAPQGPSRQEFFPSRAT